jgi:hypothetical protein
VTFFRKIEDFFFDEVRINRVKTTERFIENDQRRIVKDSSNKLKLLTHPFTEVFDFFVPPGLHFEFFKPHFDSFNRGGLA